MKIKQIAKIKGGQDGTIFNNLVFRFNHLGECFVYNLNDFKDFNDEEADVLASFKLDKSDFLAPHSNAVVFGNEYFDENDEFPLLYSNIYNNFANADDRLEGVCLVYRILREGNKFSSTLVQMIRIGFAVTGDLWSSSDKKDIRPYGNFVLDIKNNAYYGFTMRDADNTTRYFKFDLPKLSDGEYDEALGVKKVVLNESDVKEFFDCDYHRFIQGACFHDGKIYSLEGFEPGENPPAMRIIDVLEKKQAEFIDLMEYGLEAEPEFIEFENGVCYYSDHSGKFYIIEFN